MFLRSSAEPLLDVSCEQAWEHGLAGGLHGPARCTHLEQVHHMVLCRVAVLGGVLHGLYKEGLGVTSAGPQRRGLGTGSSWARVRVWGPRCEQDHFCHFQM